MKALAIVLWLLAWFAVSVAAAAAWAAARGRNASAAVAVASAASLIAAGLVFTGAVLW